MAGLDVFLEESAPGFIWIFEGLQFDNWNLMTTSPRFVILQHFFRLAAFLIDCSL